MSPQSGVPSPARGRAEQLAFRRGLSLLVLTLLVPGSAQVIAGGKGLGRFALRIWVGVLTVLALFGILLLVNQNAAITVYAQPVTQSILSVAAIVLGAGWALLLLDAWRLSRPGSMGRPRQFWMAGLAGVLALALGMGAAQASTLSRSQASLYGAVFAGGGVTDPMDGRINVLLVGADAEPDRPGIRTDTLIVASVSATTGRTVLFSLPRNLQWAPFPESSPLHALYPDGYWCEDQSCLLNAVYNLAEAHPDLYPDDDQPGMTALREVVGEILGLGINYHAMIDMTGFEDIINALGGVTIDIAERVPMGGGSSPIFDYIEAGDGVHLDGYHALWFARSRVGSSDYARMARQKCIVNAVAKQATPLNVLTRFNELAAAGASVLTTDIPTSQIGTLVSLADKGRRLPIASTSFAPPLIEPVKPDFALIRSTVVEQITASVDKDEAVARAAQASATPSPTASASPTGTPSAAASGSATATPATTAAAADTDEVRQVEDLSQICGVA